MDKQYLDCDIADGGEPPFEVSLSVDARVVSANHSGLVTIDAGYKSLSTDGGVAVVQRGAPETAFFAFMGDEHSALIAPEIGTQLPPGEDRKRVVLGKGGSVRVSFGGRPIIQKK